MSDIGIVIDSVACLPEEMIDRYGLRVVPLNIHYKDRMYREGIDISIADAYKLLAETPDEFSTSPSSAGDYLQVFREISLSYSIILCITVSSRLSTLYEMARLAGEMAEDEIPDTRIEVIDSFTASAGETLVVMAASRAAQAGKDIQEIKKVIEKVRENVRVVGIFETLRHVYRSGRVPKTAARMISAVNVRPIFAIVGGVVRMTGVETSKERGVKKLLAKIKKEVGGKRVYAVISHANVPEEGRRLQARMVKEIDCAECMLTDFSPIMGYATGEGTLVIACCPVEMIDG
jgi:DegV family protein with EDD domain